MKKLYRQFILIFIFTVMALPFSLPTMPVKALTDGDWVYVDLGGGNAEITGYIGTGSAITTPTTVSSGALTVTQLGNDAFKDNTTITSITISDGITSIENNAFLNCTSLTNVTFGNSIVTIGAFAFKDTTSLLGITLPNSMTHIGEYAFENSAVPSVADGGNLQSIGACSFKNSSLAAITLPPTLKEIGYEAFYGCQLRSITVPNSVTTLSGMGVFSFCQSLEVAVIGTGITELPAYTFDGCSKLNNVTLPPTMTSIMAFAFYNNTSLSAINLPTGLLEIGNSAFESCSFSSLTLPSKVANILESAFKDCSQLATVTFLATSSPTFGNFSFNNIKAGAQAYVPVGSKGLGAGQYNATSYPFGAGNPLTLNESDDTDDDWVYVEIIGTGTAAITGYTGTGSAITTPTTVSSGALTVKYINDSAFIGNTNITSVAISAGIIEIGANVFKGCTSLQAVIIPDGVTSIGINAFENCISLQTVTIPSGLTQISVETFKGCTALWSVGLPDSITFIRASAFNNCTSLSSITLPNGLTTIETAAFKSSGLTSITVPSFVTSMGTNVFQDCDSLTNATIGGITALPNETFSSCNLLSNVTLPSSMTSIGAGAFLNCDSLSSISLPNDLTTIGLGAFYDCDSLSSITLPNNLTTIGESAFNNSAQLGTVTFLAIAPPTFGTDSFKDIAPGARAFAPAGHIANEAGKYNATFYPFILGNPLALDGAPPVPGGGGGGGGGGSSSEPSPVVVVPAVVPVGATILVNGAAINAGTTLTSEQNGIITTTVIVDPAKLADRLAAEGSGALVVIPFTGSAQRNIGQLTGQMVKGMEDQAASVEVRTPGASFTLPAAQINIEAVRDQFGSNVPLSDIIVNIEITRAPAGAQELATLAAESGGFTLVVPPIGFTVTCTYQGKVIEVNRFNAYVERMIELPAGVDPSQISTAVVVDPSGALRHVPTMITIIDGKYYAKINSLTNSNYTLIWNPVAFSDLGTSWARTSINNMGSRLIVGGMGNNTFLPDRAITRAEFAAILVKALGLKPGTGSNPFSDIASTDWYSQAIATANSYGIISGFNNGTFSPNEKITREQAMSMIARAMRLTGLKVTLGEDEAEALLASFADHSQSAKWAKSSTAICVKAGVVSGKTGNRLAPTDKITRGEVAVIVQRLLQKSGLIN